VAWRGLYFRGIGAVLAIGQWKVVGSLRWHEGVGHGMATTASRRFVSARVLAIAKADPVVLHGLIKPTFRPHALYGTAAIL
jgi:hypothetical protein